MFRRASGRPARDPAWLSDVAAEVTRKPSPRAGGTAGPGGTGRPRDLGNETERLVAAAQNRPCYFKLELHRGWEDGPAPGNSGCGHGRRPPVGRIVCQLRPRAVLRPGIHTPHCITWAAGPCVKGASWPGEVCFVLDVRSQTSVCIGPPGSWWKCRRPPPAPPPPPRGSDSGSDSDAQGPAFLTSSPSEAGPNGAE